VPVPLIQTGQIGVGGNPTYVANLNVRESYSISVIRNRRSSAVTNAANWSPQFEKPVDNIGFKTLPDYAAYAAAHIYNIRIPGCQTNGRVFVGQRKDPFVVNLGETFDLINYANPIGEAYNNAGRDDLADKNVTSIVLEVPIACLKQNDNVIGGWTTASRARNEDGDHDSDDFIQVSRLGKPLVNELVIGLKDKDKFNASRPYDDAQFLTYVTNPSFPELVQTIFVADGILAPTLR
jgi:Domain of unknown function (DUF4331)